MLKIVFDVTKQGLTGASTLKHPHLHLLRIQLARYRKHLDNVWSVVVQEKKARGMDLNVLLPIMDGQQRRENAGSLEVSN
jgi:hypothetical protein